MDISDGHHKLMPAKKFHVRQAAVSALHAWARGQDYAESLIDRHAQRRQLSTSDRALLQAILYAVLRHRRLLDHWITKVRHGHLDPETRDVLRVGLAQLLLLDIPEHAAVNETVECGRANVRGLINAVLRRAIEMRNKLLSEVDHVSPAIAHSHPDWLFNRWVQRFGKQGATALMAWNNRPASTFLRVNPLVEALGLPMPDGPPPGMPVEGAEGFYELTSAQPPSAWLAGGAGYIQDPATRHAVELLAPQPGERILDACAAPGGKAFLIAAAQGDGSSLVCTDSNERRLPRLAENLSRLHVAGVEVAAHDWLMAAPAEWHGKFDGILLDVPCSNTGVMRRRVDVRWRLKAADIASLAAIQRRIVENALVSLKPGGRLVYSTCSIEPEENEDLIAAVLADHPDFRGGDSRVVLPHVDGTDGAFAAVLHYP